MWPINIPSDYRDDDKDNEKTTKLIYLLSSYDSILYNSI